MDTEKLEDYQKEYISNLMRLFAVKRHYQLDEKELLDFILKNFFDLKIIISPKRKLYRLKSTISG